MGVKQLWTLLGPVGRPVLLETTEGKTMAIDSSIWIYQFQATMRDKDGRALVNAHVLGFLRRICKLLFYGIKPVFVFDGGAPVLKRMTLIERKRKKAGAADSHVKVAEKLLAAHMRREAVAHVQERKARKSSSKSEPRPVIDENTVYLEDLENGAPKPTPAKDKGKQQEKSPASSKKKAKFHDHDPYRLPEVDPSLITQPTSSLAPDPRLATEEELRLFIEAMRPEDFDVSSPAFRDLPTEVQYEIVGDLRLKSRQTSHKRLQSMLRSARTPLDFSKAQIRNLQQRNTLTQQLLETTDSIGQAHVTIPVRIASERNKEYVLVKNEGQDGGWVLGIRDEGTQAKPIVLDDAGRKQRNDVEEGDSEMDMEEVTIPGVAAPDPDLREYHGRMALASVAKRNVRKKSPRRPPRPKPPLFMEEFDEEDSLDLAIKRSLEQEEADALQQAISASMTETSVSQSSDPPTGNPHPGDSDDDLYVTAPSRLDTALSFANTSPSKRHSSTTVSAGSSSFLFGKASLLLSNNKVADSGIHSTQIAESFSEDSEDDDTMEEVIPEKPTEALVRSPRSPARSVSKGTEKVAPFDPPVATVQRTPPKTPPVVTEDLSPSVTRNPNFEDLHGGTLISSPTPEQWDNSLLVVSTHDTARDGDAGDPSSSSLPPLGGIVSPSHAKSSVEADIQEVSEEESLNEWERSSTPLAGRSTEDASTIPATQPEAEHWDAAQEMDVAAEEGDFAQFVSRVKGQDLDAARQDIDEEIRDLNKQKKIAMRDSEDITQQMISQIMLMLRLFGIPYITAPMEAEAQCAALVSLGLVDGIITDDSDVFLFGGLRVYKNMFNQSKTIESFLLSDLARELGLDRDKLIRLAYLLGSDYVDGLPGVGPVVAMELLTEFPGENGLHKFKEWWKKVQSGKDTSSDTSSKFRRRFKKKFKDLYLPEDWPNPAVRDAYYHPAVDESDDPFKWGLPDLDALRDFFREELGWHQDKVDDLLLPIIRKMGQRAQAAAANRQGTLDSHFNVTLGDGTFAPRKRQAYSSKRLQQVVADFRAKQNKPQNGGTVGPAADDSELNTGEGPPKKKRRKGEKDTAEALKKKPTRNPRSVQRGRGRKRKTVTPSSAGSDGEVSGRAESPPPPPLAAKLRPRPKPAFKEPSAVEDVEEQEDSEEEFVIKRSRRNL